MKGLFFHNVPEELQDTLERLASIEPNDLEKTILGSLWAGMNIEYVMEDLKKEGIKRGAFSEEEIKKVIQNLQAHGLIDGNMFITEKGVAIFNSIG